MGLNRFNRQPKYRYDNDNLKFHDVKWYGENWVLLVIGALLISAIIIYEVSSTSKVAKEFVEGETVSTIIIPQPEFSPKLLREYMEEINMKFPDIVYAQAVIETGQFSSTIFKENHNLFGMKCAKSRAYTHLGESRNHAQYENWKMSVLDYALYQARYLGDLKTREQYYAYIGSHYAEDPMYLRKVKQIVKKLNYK